MSMSMRDRIATLLVAAAVVVYGARLLELLGGTTVGAVAVVVLVLGVLASASAVVPGFAALLRGSKVYLLIASVLGLAALATGVLTVLNATEITLALLVGATIVLWVLATWRHSTPPAPAA